jgi:hypothetical protein
VISFQWPSTQNITGTFLTVPDRQVFGQGVLSDPRFFSGTVRPESLFAVLDKLSEPGTGKLPSGAAAEMFFAMLCATVVGIDQLPPDKREAWTAIFERECKREAAQILIDRGDGQS